MPNTTNNYYNDYQALIVEMREDQLLGTTISRSLFYHLCIV